MDGARLARDMVAFSLCAAAMGCGGGGSDTERSRGAAPQSLLPRPIQPSCGVKDYSRPQIRRSSTESGRGSRWTLEYALRAGSSPAAAPFERLLLVEYPPSRRALPRAPTSDAITIQGRRVSLQRPTRPGVPYVMQWSTARAIYTLLAMPRDGRKIASQVPRELRRVVTCLP